MNALLAKSTGTEAEILAIGAASAKIDEGQKLIEDLSSLLTHIDGVMRFGEAIAEGHKQESLQHIANLKNRELVQTKAIHAPRIETVETYFTIKLPGKVKSALGNSEEEIALYGRQATAGHGRGTDIDPDIAYNPTPQVGLHPNPKYQGSNAIQVSNSGAAFDYGSMAITHPDARALHGYDHFTQDAVNRGAYFDLFDSKINNSAYALAADMGRRPETWEEKRKWYEKQRKELIPHLDSTEAPLTGEYAELVDLYQKATEHRFAQADASLLLSKIRANNQLNLGSSTLKDTYLMRSNRLQHLTLQTVMSGLDRSAAEMLLQADSYHANALRTFMERTESVILNHTEGMGRVPVQPLYNLWDRMRLSRSSYVRNTGKLKQYRNLFVSHESGEGNELLETQFIKDLRDPDFSTRMQALNELKEMTQTKLDVSSLFSMPEMQEAIIANYAMNSSPGINPVLEFLNAKEQRALAIRLLVQPQTRKTPETIRALEQIRNHLIAKKTGLKPSTRCLLESLYNLTDDVSIPSSK